MATKTEKTTPFKEGQNTNDHKGDAPTVKVKSNMSKVHGSGSSDALHAALSHRNSYVPSDNHIVSHTTTITPTGAHYEPRGEFGSVARQGEGKGVYSYEGAPNRKGDNALGKMMNKVGEKSGYAKGGKKSGGGGRRA